jgi:hypothetical protein
MNPSQLPNEIYKLLSLELKALPSDKWLFWPLKWSLFLKRINGQYRTLKHAYNEFWRQYLYILSILHQYRTVKQAYIEFSRQYLYILSILHQSEQNIYFSTNEILDPIEKKKHEAELLRSQ